MSRLAELRMQSVLMLSTGFEPLFQTSWTRAITAVVSGRAEIIEVHKTLRIGTPRGEVPLPTKVRFTSGVIAARVKNLNSDAPLSRKNVHIRDNGRCQYCDSIMSVANSTIDHVIPRSKGGHHQWDNVVLACEKCNQRKGDKLPGEFHIKLKRRPSAPSMLDLGAGIIKC